MNKEVIKAMERSTKKHRARNWRKKVRRKVSHFFSRLAHPYYKLKTWKYNRNVKRYAWNEERAQAILNYYIPRKARWFADDSAFYFFDNGYGWRIGQAKKYLKRKDRKFWQYNTMGLFGDKMRKYLIEKFELEHFDKEVNDLSDGYTEITFWLKEE